MPNLPPDISTKIKIDHDGLIKLLLISIALEEISLSHILNAEGELMQAFIRSIKCKPCKFEEIYKFNRSISDTLQILLDKEKTLKEKLTKVVNFDEDHLSVECRKYYLDDDCF